MKKGIHRITALFLAGIFCLTSCGSEQIATTMALSKTEGTVNVLDRRQQEIEPAEQLRLYSGYQVETHPVSYAWIDLDKVKLTKMDEESEIEIKKRRNDLEIVVNSGKLFFHITEPLKDEENLNIRTSSMIVGIRGTCGWVEAMEKEQMRVYVLEGTVACTIDKSGMRDHRNSPGDSQGKISMQEILHQVLFRIIPSGDKDREYGHSDVHEDEALYVSGGKMAELTYSSDKEAQIVLSEFDVSDIPDYVMEELMEDEELRQKIAEESGLDVGGGTPEGDSDGYPLERDSDGYPEENSDESDTASSFLKNTVYYGNSDICRLTPAQAGAFAREIQESIDRGAAEFEEYVSSHPFFGGQEYQFLSRAALFDAGDGIPGVFFSCGMYGDSYAGNLPGPQQIHWVMPIEQTVLYLGDGGEIYHTGIEKMFLGDGYLFGGGIWGDGSGYDGYVYPLVNGRMEAASTMASSDLVNQVFQVDWSPATRGEFDRWVDQWQVESEVGYTHANDISGSCWGMVPAEEVIAVCNDYAGRG